MYGVIVMTTDTTKRQRVNEKAEEYGITLPDMLTYKIPQKERLINEYAQLNEDIEKGTDILYNIYSFDDVEEFFPQFVERAEELVEEVDEFDDEVLVLDIEFTGEEDDGRDDYEYRVKYCEDRKSYKLDKVMTFIPLKMFAESGEKEIYEKVENGLKNCLDEKRLRMKRVKSNVEKNEDMVTEKK
jgi:hypothetical protein